MERLDEKAFLIKLDANTFVKLIDGKRNYYVCRALSVSSSCLRRG
jgi:hypothetical protein